MTKIDLGGQALVSEEYAIAYGVHNAIASLYAEFLTAYNSGAKSDDELIKWVEVMQNADAVYDAAYAKEHTPC